jgi:hypothetical protein
MQCDVQMLVYLASRLNIWPPVQRVHDGYIMDMILASGQFKPAQIQQFNCCRMYLQAATISDITRANGMQLDMPMYRGQPSPQSSTSS